MTRGQGCAEEDQARESGWSRGGVSGIIERRGDMEDTASRLTSCYNRLWESKRWPKLWKRELVKVFKKGCLREYKNWRGVTLLRTCHYKDIL